MKDAILVVACVLVIGCNRTSPDLVGTWKGRYEIDREAETADPGFPLGTLELTHVYGADGTFRSVSKNTRSKDWVESDGTWKLINIDGNEVTFETALIEKGKPTGQISKVTIKFDGPDRFQHRFDGIPGASGVVFERQDQSNLAR